LQDDEASATITIDHIISKQHGGNDDLSVLALACWYCNTHKGSNLSAIDPETGRVVSLYNPRLERWCDHFSREGARIVGLTPEGRATARLLGMNRVARIEYRTELD
jgi:hypothetical protein